MTRSRVPAAALLPILLATVLAPGAAAQDIHRVTSPDTRNVVEVATREGRLTYTVDRSGRRILLPSSLGFEFRGQPRLRDSLRITGATRRSYDSTWVQPWGEVARVREHYNELRVSVVETTGPRREFTVAFRVFNDGVGFRYEVPRQPGLGEFEMTDELTEFSMADDARAWTAARCCTPHRR
jgi:alpha-glucosidase